MRRALALGTLLLMSLGVLGYGLGTSCCPPPNEPCCYTSFWVGETVHFKLVVPWGFFCCCCGDEELVTGWRIETLDGTVVYQYTFPEPVSPGTEIQWDQKDANGNQVAPGFYNIVVTTTKGEYKTAIKIVEKDCCCWGLWSRPCGASLCKPYIKVYRCPPPCAPCFIPFLPCTNCHVTLFLGCCGDEP